MNDPGRLARIAAWLEVRTGYAALARAALDRPVAGGPRPRYVFGSVLLFLLLNQSVTGVLLAAGYAPSVGDAWASVAYVQELAPAGWFIRGLHAHGASVAILVMLLHLAQVVWAGAYRAPREATWWIGLGLLGVLLAFGLTGYLLPWDQKGFFATQVATNLLGATPLVGRMAQELALGGASYGNLTLTRFFALHAIVLPAIALGLVVLHVGLVRRHGVTPPADLAPDAAAARTAPFYPRQAALDAGAIALAAAALAGWVVATHGAPLAAPADPSSSYDARPEWYFLPLFELLRRLPASLERVGAFGLPLGAFGLLALLPFLDRGASGSPRARARPLAMVAALGLALVGLAVSAVVADGRDDAYRAGRARAEAQANGARLRFRARLGAPPTDPAGRRALGDAVFDAHCAECHRLDDRGAARAPTLTAWSSRGWIDGFLAAPAGERYFGPTHVRGMKPVNIEGADRAALVEWIWALGGADGADAAKVAQGARLFDSLECGDCHERDGRTPGGGAPNLGGHGGADWLAGLIRDAGGPTYFGAKNEMPRFAERLTDAEIAALVERLRGAR